MPLDARTVDTRLANKFGFNRSEGSSHVKFRLEVDGVFVAHTRMSRGGSDIGDPLIGAMARQLGVTASQFRQMVECTIDRDAYLGLVLPGR